MIGAIPNPTKKVTIDFSVDKVKQGIKDIPKAMSKYKFTKENQMFNQITLEASEFLSLGVFIDFNLNPVSDNRTEINLEVRRKMGAFDNWVEVQNANEHIQKLFDGLTRTLTTPAGQLTQVKEPSSWPTVIGFIIGLSILSALLS